MRTGLIRVLTLSFWAGGIALESGPVFREAALNWFGEGWGIAPAIWCVAALSAWLWSIASCLAEIVILHAERAMLRATMRRLR